MPRRTLIDFYADLSSTAGEFVVYDDGYRSWSYSYADVASGARAFASRLRGSGIGKGDTITIWAENRAEWIIALWGCLLEGIVLVPIDYRASADFLVRVSDIVKARAVLVGDAVERDAIGTTRPVWHVSELRDFRLKPEATGPLINADDTAEIIFTSGATAEPKGVVITHKNVLANIVPVEREIVKYRKWARPFQPLRFLNLLPLSHMFGQAMATFIPAMVPGSVVFIRGYNPVDIVRQIKARRVSVLVSVPKILEVVRDYVVRTADHARLKLPATADDARP